jgi:hypothetical protein
VDPEYLRLAAIPILMRLAALLLFSSLAVAQSLPDAPSANLPIEFSDGNGLWRQVQELPPDPSTHWYKAQPSFRQVLKSKSFWLPELAAYGSAIADAHKNNCNPVSNAPCGRHIYLDALSPMLFVTPMHLLASRSLSPLFGLGACAYVITRHIRGAVTGVYP